MREGYKPDTGRPKGTKRVNAIVSVSLVVSVWLLLCGLDILLFGVERLSRPLDNSDFNLLIAIIVGVIVVHELDEHKGPGK